MKNPTKQAFTLVELIVVITILAILGTIAFISLEGYSKNSRDGVRIADVNSIQKNLGIYIIEKGTYPIPDDYENVTYSGATAWIEGTVGDTVIRNLDKINKKPLDPLTGNEYTYSVTSGKTEYQIGAISESGQMGYKLPINQTHAATEKKVNAMIKGTYNERFLKVKSGSLNWILAVPSIITTDITQLDLATILTSKKLVYNNYSNLPHSYSDKGYTMTGGFDYTNANPLVYSGGMDTLLTNENKLIFIDNLKTAYNGTIIQGEPNYQDIINTNTGTNEIIAISLVNNYMNTNVGGIKPQNFILPTSIYTCETKPSYTNVTYISGEPTQVNQPWQNTNNSNPCYYECTGGYTGSDCNTPPIQQWKDIPGTSCTNNDYVFTLSGTTYRWAGCNSILGTTGIGIRENDLYVGNCYNYSGATTTINCNSTFLTYTAKENAFNSTYGEDNIWGKLYLWANAVQANNACPTGWHLPSDYEFQRLETYLNGGVVCTSSSYTRGCDGLGWAGKSGKDSTNNIVKALKIPLAGYRQSGGFHRGNGATLRTSNLYSTYAVHRYLNQSISSVLRFYGNKTLQGYSVRCIKD